MLAHCFGQHTLPTCSQGADSTGNIACILILTQLELADQTVNINLDTHNRGQHLANVIRAGISHFPGPLRGNLPLVLSGQTRYQPAHKARIIAQAKPTMSMHNLIVLGRYLAMGFMLTRIPVGRDIALRPLKDHQHRHTVNHLLHQGVGARDVTL